MMLLSFTAGVVLGLVVRRWGEPARVRETARAFVEVHGEAAGVAVRAIKARAWSRTAFWDAVALDIAEELRRARARALGVPE